MGDLIRKDEVESAVEARRELGTDYDDAVLEAFVEKVERRLEERLEQRPAKGAPPAFAVPLGSLGLAIPLLGVAGGTAGLPGVAFVCLMIAIVNLAYAFTRRKM